MTDRATASPPAPRAPLREVFLAFLVLGLTSFGGPIAHLGYFRTAFVIRRRWLTEEAYADLVALAQFLPGPASSQVGFALGWLRGGLPGALVAWAAFTLPSALLLVLFALTAGRLSDPLALALVSGLKIVAVAIVAQAVLGMAQSLCPDRNRATIAVAAAALVLTVPGSFAQIAVIAFGAAAGIAVCPGQPAGHAGALPLRISRRAGLVAFALFALLLVGLPILAASSVTPALAVADVFYRAGALVFGGGHVVLPLLEEGVVGRGWVTTGEFLTGYGITQAMPGPLFTCAAYLGALLQPGPHGLGGATIALVAIFLPGLLLMTGALPFWSAIRDRPRARAAMQGTNAAVVGILAAALYDPVFTGAIGNGRAFAVACVCFVLLVSWRTPPWIVVLLGMAGGALIAL